MLVLLTPWLLFGVSHAQHCYDLRYLRSPWTGSTRDQSNSVNTSCGGNGRERIFKIDVPNGYTLRIGQISNNYDSRHELKIGGWCPGLISVVCRDDPDTHMEEWTNHSGMTQPAYFHVDAYSNGSGEFTLSWMIIPWRCSGNMFFLSELSSPYHGTTWGRRNWMNLDCGGSAPETIFTVNVPANHRLRIRQQSNGFDSRHQLKWGGQCPGANMIACRDDPDTHWEQWDNNTGAPQDVYYVIDGYTTGAGAFTLEWNVAVNTPAPTRAPTIPPCRSLNKERCTGEALHRCVWHNGCHDPHCQPVDEEGCVNFLGGKRCGWDSGRNRCQRCNELSSAQECRERRNCMWTKNLFTDSGLGTSEEICMACGDGEDWFGLGEEICKCSYCAWVGYIDQECSTCMQYSMNFNSPGKTGYKGWPCKQCMEKVLRCGNKTFDEYVAGIDCTSLRCDFMSGTCINHTTEYTCKANLPGRNFSPCQWTGQICVEAWAFNAQNSRGVSLCPSGDGISRRALDGEEGSEEGTTDGSPDIHVHAAQMRQDDEGGEL